MQTVRLARHAMATRFEIVLHGDNAVDLRAAGEEALDEITRLESRLSLYDPQSEIAHVNSTAALEPVRVSPPVFELLRHALQLSRDTGGAFDITIAPLVRCWGFMGGSGRTAEPADLAEARTRIGPGRVVLEEEQRTVRFEADGVMLDLGAIGKGYAVEAAVAVLRDAGVTSALVHGGTSTVYGLGHPPEQAGWKIAIDEPPSPGQGAKCPEPLVVALRDEALSVSAVWGKFFSADGRTFGHVLDPRSGYPVDGALLAAVVSGSATETDAFSTGLLVLGVEGLDAIAGLRPGMKTVVLMRDGTGYRREKRGFVD